MFQEIIGRKEKPQKISKKFWRGKKVLITGAGSIGAAIVAELEKIVSSNSMQIIDRDEEKIFWAKKSSPLLDARVINVSSLTALEVAQFDIVIHTAANKHVQLCELNKSEAINNNVSATAYLAGLCLINNTHFCFISTDKAVMAKNFYAKTKAVAERVVDSYRKQGLDCCIIRFANVFDSSGSIIRVWKRAWINKKLILAVRDTWRWFISLREASTNILKAIEESYKKDEKYLFAIKPENQTKIEDMAKAFNKRFSVYVKFCDRPSFDHKEEKFAHCDQVLKKVNGLLYSIEKDSRNG